MRRIENHGREFAHDGERAHIHNQVVVAETGAALRQKDLSIPCLAAFFHCVTHVPGRNELSFLDVDCPAAERCGDHKVSLTTQKRGNLQHVDNFCDFTDIHRCVYISEHRNLHLVFDFF